MIQQINFDRWSITTIYVTFQIWKVMEDHHNVMCNKFYNIRTHMMFMKEIPKC